MLRGGGYRRNKEISAHRILVAGEEARNIPQKVADGKEPGICYFRMINLIVSLFALQATLPLGR